jgi:hypothetical protein
MDADLVRGERMPRSRKAPCALIKKKVLWPMRGFMGGWFDAGERLLGKFFQRICPAAQVCKHFSSFLQGRGKICGCVCGCVCGCFFPSCFSVFHLVQENGAGGKKSILSNKIRHICTIIVVGGEGLEPTTFTV